MWIQFPLAMISTLVGPKQIWSLKDGVYEL
jgi:hypothetical protein